MNYMENRVLKTGNQCFSEAYRELSLELIAQDSRVIMGDADLGRAMYGSDYAQLKKEHAQNMFDVGIQEANLVGVSAGLAVTGRIPIAHSFAAFITRRTYDTIFVSGAYAKLNLNLIGSDPGITSTYNGGTHMTFEDIALMGSIPGAVVFEPADITALKKLFPKVVYADGISYTRFARKIKPVKLYSEDARFEIGKAMELCSGQDATIIALGTEVVEAVKVAELLEKDGIHVRVLDAVTVKPLDREAVIRAAKETGAIVTAENHNIKTGLYAAVCECLASECPCPAVPVGIPDCFGEVGNYEELIHRFKLTAEDIAAAVRVCLAKKA